MRNDHQINNGSIEQQMNAVFTKGGFHANINQNMHGTIRKQAKRGYRPSTSKQQTIFKLLRVYYEPNRNAH